MDLQDYNRNWQILFILFILSKFIRNFRLEIDAFLIFILFIFILLILSYCPFCPFHRIWLASPSA